MYFGSEPDWHGASNSSCVGGRVGGRDFGRLGVYRKRIRRSIGGSQGPQWHITGVKEGDVERKEPKRGQMGLTWAGEVLGHQ